MVCTDPKPTAEDLRLIHHEQSQLTLFSHHPTTLQLFELLTDRLPHTPEFPHERPDGVEAHKPEAGLLVHPP